MGNEHEGIYRHFKGNYYEVVGSAVDEATGEAFILYRQMYEPFGYWIRPEKMFFGEKQTDTGPIKRFKKVGVSLVNSLRWEKIESLTLRHSETLAEYKIVKQDLDKAVFYVKAAE